VKLDLQRGVVQNEKRQGENQPYGVTEELLAENTYPVGHPYSWTVIGSMKELDAASLSAITFVPSLASQLLLSGDYTNYPPRQGDTKGLLV
jgi:hypothetical protein